MFASNSTQDLQLVERPEILIAHGILQSRLQYNQANTQTIRCTAAQVTKIQAVLLLVCAMPSPSAHTVRGGQGYVTHKNPGMETQARLFCAVVVPVYEKVSRYTNGRARIFSFALTILFLVQKERYSRLSLFRKSSRLALQRMSR